MNFWLTADSVNVPLQSLVFFTMSLIPSRVQSTNVASIIFVPRLGLPASVEHSSFGLELPSLSQTQLQRRLHVADPTGLSSPGDLPRFLQRCQKHQNSNCLLSLSVIAVIVSVTVGPLNVDKVSFCFCLSPKV
eukprot:TRINITY_DN1414_c0_g1_i2.p1 TRINITY_DN1414_c0_g1~~TRINITY_DN1414_c0_g1_i2.p1  ORF type:complete len:133 (-),score=4.74 TRINITY_DN1414_c0_g1_i2:485-883(-)